MKFNPRFIDVGSDSAVVRKLPGADTDGGRYSSGLPSARPLHSGEGHQQHGLLNFGFSFLDQSETGVKTFLFLRFGNLNRKREGCLIQE